MYIFRSKTSKKSTKPRGGEIDVNFHAIFLSAVDMAEKVGTQPSMPKVVSRQKGKANNPATTPEEYFKRNVAIPFIDHITTNLEEKFNG